MEKISVAEFTYKKKSHYICIKFRHRENNGRENSN